MSDDTKARDSSSLAPGETVRLLVSTAPPGEAQQLARKLVDEGLAACVNLVPGLRSIYRWKDQVADDPETLLLIKTSAARVEDLAGRLTALHPYQVPELLSLRPEEGLAAYLAWVGEQTAKP